MSMLSDFIVIEKHDAKKAATPNLREGQYQMSLISCPECKKEISDKAFDCPHCGRPLHKRDADLLTEQFVGSWSNVGKLLKWALIIIGLVTLLGIISVAFETYETRSSNDNAATPNK
jgi:hypothetical protein